jgi:hypothetical protein
MIEHESHAHPHHSGRHWFDLILAGSAIFISVVSVFISIHHGQTMEKLVAANEKQVRASTLPILRFGTGNSDSSDKADIYFDLTNGGTGPAIIEWLRIKWNGQPATGPRDLLKRCCATEPSQKTPPFSISTVSGATLPAGQSQIVFSLRAEDAGPDLFKHLDRDVRPKIEAEACYCSVLDECWTTDFDTRPKLVPSCEFVAESEHW